ncbi:MAG: sigma-70 family RNA polymerase sigma factor [Xanthomonadales bacterium]|nr:sigma-70 family RNA polymerase sigma factor [Xanthomonadales bacterium]
MNGDEPDDPPSTSALFAQVYERLKTMAGRHLAHAPGGTLDTTAVVHELYLRINSGDELHFDRPEKFFAYAARAMRHLLANRARHTLRLRAGGGWTRVTLSASDQRLAMDSAEQALAVDEALNQLGQIDARAARVAELFVFAGLEQDKIGETLGVSRITVARDWRFARAFLKQALS